MIRNIVFDIGNVLIGFDAMDYLVSLFGEEKAVRIAKAVFGTGYWQELDIARLSEEEILELFYSGAPDLRDEIKESFDRIGECVAPELRGEVAEINMVDFIDPGVAEPLVGVQDELEEAADAAVKRRRDDR